jgi:S-adenosylmethionine-diacylgycerolhomoserine-N-methlytransferase
MNWLADLRTLYALTLAPVRGSGHAARLESFYGRQAAGYDAFRDRLLHGRHELLRSLTMPSEGTWIDVGGGTGSSVEALGPAVDRLRRIVLVDLSPSLLAVARRRIERLGLRHVSLVRADATDTFARAGTADVITFSYSLTMIPDWYAAIEQAWRALKPGGALGVVDFFVSRRHPHEGGARHTWCARHGWPAWFDHDGVRPSPDHLPYLQWRFATVQCTEHTARLPYLPGVRVPYYRFVGRRV